MIAKVEIPYSKVYPCFITGILLLFTFTVIYKLISDAESLAPIYWYVILVLLVVSIWRITKELTIPAFNKKPGLELTEDFLIDHSNNEEIGWSNIHHFELQIRNRISVHLIDKEQHPVKYIGFWKQKLFYGSPIVINTHMLKVTGQGLYRLLSTYLKEVQKQHTTAVIDA
ncbi:hypothetical protein [Mucilaginibacter psychrotolerans]|uniref:Uncharacterized protein n=1 Tax=Mucilaginibacter psychrotolerans TaxID=1524096 RepID=A0A4Y8SPI1_9SPHI|nr:hypothetical protein [Mucilaginibacter psychrotolerans]TFF40959.1 hypothetical protein E2R66_01930 [Mucilaginibacter psychrotolerans]